MCRWEAIPLIDWLWWVPSFLPIKKLVQKLWNYWQARGTRCIWGVYYCGKRRIFHPTGGWILCGSTSCSSLPNKHPIGWHPCWTPKCALRDGPSISQKCELLHYFIARIYSTIEENWNGWRRPLPSPDAVQRMKRGSIIAGQAGIQQQIIIVVPTWSSMYQFRVHQIPELFGIRVALSHRPPSSGQIHETFQWVRWRPKVSDETVRRNYVCTRYRKVPTPSHPT